MSQIVVVEKKQSDHVRLCIPDLSTKPCRGNIITYLPWKRLYLTFGYWHVFLDKSSRKLTCSQTPFGRFVWNRLPFGLKVSPEIFQKLAHAALYELLGVNCIADDIIAGVGVDLQAVAASLNFNLISFLIRCTKKGIVLNPDKSGHCVTSIPFMGHLLTYGCLKPDADKESVILDMPVPTDVAAVRRSNGTVNLQAKFLHRLSSIIKLLTSLTCKDTTRTWRPEHDQAVKAAKQQMSKAPLLRHYGPVEEFVMQCNISCSFTIYGVYSFACPLCK